MSGRRGLLGAVGGCLLGAAVILVAAGRTWVRATGAGGLASGLDVRLTGRSVAAAVPALGLVALGGTVAVIATRGRPRRAVGALLTAVGGWTCWLAVHVLADPAGAARGADAVRGAADARAADPTGWPWAAGVGGLLVALAGLTAVVRGKDWPGMSARYDRPEPAQRKPGSPELALWEALDRGDDPT